jgi:uncharacterized protein (UPF0335 family)
MIITVSSEQGIFFLDENYIKGVLGIDALLLTEGTLHTSAVQRLIVQEHLLFEGWFDTAKKIPGDMKNMALAMRYMMEDGSRIKDFVSTVYENVIKDPLAKIADFVANIMSKVKGWFETFVMPKLKSGWEKIQEFFGKVGKMLQETWEKISGMSGWKQALAAMAFGAGVGYMWVKLNLKKHLEKLGKLIDKGTEAVEKWGAKLKDLAKKHGGKLTLGGEGTNESYTPTLANLFLEGESGDEEPAKGDSLLKKAWDAIGTHAKKIFNYFKENIKGFADKIFKKLGFQAISSIMSGGVGTFINAVGAAYGGVSMLSQLFGDSLGAFVSKIENPEEEAKEMEAGEDDPTEKSESIFRDERLLREYIREKMLAQAS